MSELFKDEIYQKKLGLKLNSQKKQESTALEEKFDDKIKNFISKHEDVKKQAQILTSQFQSLLLNKTLKANLGPKEIQTEKNIIDDLNKVANEINQIEELPEGMGSLMIGILNLRISILFRDRLNEIEFATRKLIENFSKIENKINDIKDLDKNGK